MQNRYIKHIITWGLTLGIVSSAAARSQDIPIHFRGASKHLVLRGVLSVQRPKVAYVGWFKKGEVLTVSVSGTRKSEAIVPSWHITFPDGKDYGGKGYDPFDGRLTESGRYRITINVNQMASTGRRGAYKVILKR